MENILNENDENKNSIKKLSLTGKCLLLLTGGVGLGITIISSSFVAPAFRRYCLPYIPATPEQISNVLSCIPKNIKNSSRLLDIGSGDGRIVIATAKHGIKSDGVELNPWLVWYSKYIAFRNNMKDLEKKLLNEAQSNTKVIACRFPLPNLKADKIINDGVNTVWLYQIKN